MENPSASSLSPGSQVLEEVSEGKRGSRGNALSPTALGPLALSLCGGLKEWSFKFQSPGPLGLAILALTHDGWASHESWGPALCCSLPPGPWPT